MEEFTTTISVRELVDFAYRTGNLGGSGKIVSSSRAVEGTRGHRRLQRERGAGYDAEIGVEATASRDDVTMKIVGRVDGIRAAASPPMVEEIKTVKAGWSGEADPMHRAQLRIYAAILAGQRGWEGVEVRLTYLDLETGEESIFAEVEGASSLAAFYEATVEFWFGWLIPKARWETERNASVAAMEFPLGGFRSGQREFSVEVFRTIRDGGQLFAEAPTGTGKTLATLFPAVKALPQIAGQIFYVTAKTPGRIAAAEALAHLRGAGAKLRSVALTAKRKICFNAGSSGCDLRTCPFALGYFDRYRPALRELLGRETLDREAIEEVARAHTVCPFELSLDASVWTDVVIGDLNYVFDPTARLQRHFEIGDRRHVVLVDEAHNLVDRSREMYSATLRAGDFKLEGGPKMKGTGSGRARAAFAETARTLADFAGAGVQSEIAERRYHAGGVAVKARPDELITGLRENASAIERFLTEQPEGADLSTWLEPWFELLAFLRAADGYDEKCWTICQPDERSVRIFCADASGRLAETLGGLQATVFFSATLTPLDYFQRLLGGGEGSRSLEIASPFAGDQMRLTVLGADVTYQGREASLPAVTRAVAQHVASLAGNHLVFCPSFAYLDSLSGELDEFDFDLVEQTSSMGEAARDEFLAKFERAGDAVGLAVLGGVFAEGIDLPGDRVVGVTVIGIGLPGLSLERDILVREFERTHGSGFDYAYRLPGMQRVLQAVGRLIRSERDRGVVLLVDQRFNEARTRKLLPAWWPVLQGDRD